MKDTGAMLPLPTPPGGRRALLMLDVWKIVGIVGIGLAMVWFVAHIVDVLLVFFAAIVFAEAIRPLVQFGVKRLKLPRFLATIFVYLLIIAVLAALIYVVVSPLVEQIQNLTQNFPDIVNAIQQRLAVWNRSQVGAAIINAIASQTQALGNLFLGAALSVPSIAFSVLFNIAFTLFLAFYWLNSTAGLRIFSLSLFPDRAQTLVDSMFDEMGLLLGGYVRSVIINMVVIGTITSLVLWVFGIPYPLVLGVFAALTEAIPLVGPYIGGFPAVVLAFTISPLKATLVIITYVLVQQFESNTLVPWVIGRTVGLNPLVTLLSVLMGASLYGIPGRCWRCRSWRLFRRFSCDL